MPTPVVDGEAAEVERQCPRRPNSRVHANAAEVLDRLTPRERELLVANGLAQRGVGARLEQAVGRVKVHVSAVLSKLAVQ
jgi:DNA-binding NarL/FixJ family response regulator